MGRLFRFVSPKTRLKMLAMGSHEMETETPTTPTPHLTRREAQVLALLAQGYHNREIAALLFIGVETVKTHVDHIFNKLGVRRRVTVALWARQKLFR